MLKTKQYSKALDLLVTDLKNAIHDDLKSSINEINILRKLIRLANSITNIKPGLVELSKTYGMNKDIHFVKSLVVNLIDELEEE